MVTRNTFRIYLLWLSSLFLLQGSLVCAALTASVDRTAISENDIINLTIRSTEGAIAEGEDLAAMLVDFTILNSQRSHQFNYVNGQGSSSYDLILTLAPNQSGTLTIPAFTGHGESTTPIRISVSPGSSDPRQELNEVFIESSVSKETVYVQEQLILTVKIHHAVGLSEASITEPDIADARVQKLGEDQKSETLIKGMRYSVIERNYAIFPQASGQLQVPEQLLNARTLSRFGTMFRADGQVVRVKSKPITVTVLPKPDAFPANEPWLPAAALVINDSWAELDLRVRAGEPVTRTITVTARGVSAAQLPVIQLPQVAGLKMYPDQPQLDEQATAQGLVAEQTSATAIVPTREGNYSIPQIRIYWWNTTTNQLMTHLIKGKNIQASAAQLVAQPDAHVPQEGRMEIQPAVEGRAVGPGYWLWPTLTALFALLWLATIYLWLSAKARTNHDSPASDTAYRQRLESRYQAHRRLREACSAQDLTAVRAALLVWFKAVFPNELIMNLDDVAHLNCHPQLARILIELDARLYGKITDNSPWDGKPLLKVLEQIRKTQHRKTGASHAWSLPYLYPGREQPD